MALSLFCDCCLGQALVPCAICVLMGFVIPGGAQGAQHSGGAAMAVLISTMLGRESGNPPHPAHGYLQDKGFPALSQNCTCPVHADQSFSKMQSEQSSSPSQYCSCCAVLGAGTRGQAVLGGPRAESPCVCGVGGLAELSGQHTSLQFHCIVPQENSGWQLQ